MNFIKRFFEQRRKKRQAVQVKHTLEQLSLIHETFGMYRKSGLLYVDFKRNTVTIAQILAEYFIYNDDDWQRFLKQLYHWAVYEYSVNEYTRLFNKAKADAEAEANKAKRAEAAEKNDTELSLTEAERQIAKMRAASKFDSEYGGRPVAVPDLQFIVLGIADGKPLCVAQLVNGKFETAVVEE